MSYFKNFQVGPNAVFGELIQSELTPVIQISNKYRIDPANLDNIQVFEATGGTAGNDGNLFLCQTGTSVGGYGVIRSNNNIIYLAGEGIEARFTGAFTTGVANSLQFAGLFSLTETVAFGYDGTAFSCLHSYDGAAEVVTFQIDSTPSGTENCIIELDAVTQSVQITNSTVQTNAREITNECNGDASAFSGTWRFEQVDDTVYAIAQSAAAKAGANSFSSSTATATVTEETAGAAKTDNHTAQASWNITTSPFSGFDPTKINVYRITFGYLGVANITYSIYNPNTGKFVDVHRIKWSNNNLVTHLGSPDLKIGWTSASLGSTTNLEVRGGSAYVAIQGKELVRNQAFAADNTVASISTTLTNLLTIKNRIVYADRFNLGKIRPELISVDNDHNKGTVIEIYKNSTVAGTPNFQYEDEFNSIAIVDKAGTTVTGGTLLASFTVAANGSAIFNIDALKIDLLPEDQIVVAAKTTTGTSTNITAAVTWVEEK